MIARTDKLDSINVFASFLTYIDEFDPVLLDGVESDGDVLDLVVLVVGFLVVAPQLPFLKLLHQSHQNCPVPEKVRKGKVSFVAFVYTCRLIRHKYTLDLEPTSSFRNYCSFHQASYPSVTNLIKSHVSRNRDLLWS